MKIICAGLQKTGTKSMAEALRMLGYNVHDVFEQYALDRELWEKVRNNAATMEDYKRVLDNVDAVTDIPALGLWDEILKAFPNALVILMVRSSEDEWCDSVKRHCKYMYEHTPLVRYNLPRFIHNFLFGPKFRDYSQYQEDFMLGCTGFRVMYKKPPMDAVLRMKYRQHNAYVKNTCPRDQLLVFNVKDGWDPLCEFLDLPAPNTPFPVVNVDGEVVHQVVAGQFDVLGLTKTVWQQAFLRFGGCAVVIAAFLICLLQTYAL